MNDDYILVSGGKALNGTITINGSKNASLPIMAGALLSDDLITLLDVPDLHDTRVMSDLLVGVGANISTISHVGEKTLNITAHKHALSPDLLMNEARKMRASVILFGPLLTRLGRASVPLPGGCPIGARPLDIHVNALQSMGADIYYDGDFLRGECKNGLQGAEVVLRFPSVGATENVLMAATLANGVTVIKNAAKEPEITDLARFLSSMGANISGAGTYTITIIGVKKLHATSHKIIPDRIEAITYLIATAVTGGVITVNNVCYDDISFELNVLRQMGFDKINVNDNSITLDSRNAKPRAVQLTTGPYPDGLPTDVQAQFMVLMNSVDGISSITETVFENRFQHVQALNKMGANIIQNGETCIIHGAQSLCGTDVIATDLRASSCLVIAGLIASGTTKVMGLHHLYRGYVRLPEKLSACGADVQLFIGDGY